MRHPVLAQHGLEAKLQASREAVAHLPRESGVNAFPNPRVAYCGFCQKHVAVSRLGSLDSLKKHMVERHHPCLGGVLDGSTRLADMEDPPEGGLKEKFRCDFRLSIAGFRYVMNACIISGPRHRHSLSRRRRRAVRAWLVALGRQALLKKTCIDFLPLKSVCLHDRRPGRAGEHRSFSTGGGNCGSMAR